MKKIIFLIFIAITSCTPYIKSDFSRNYAALSSKDSITIFSQEIYLNRNNSKDLKIGSIIVGDKGATRKCDSITMINIIKDSARVHGANIIGVTNHIKPSFWGSTCHQFHADFLRGNIIKIDSTDQNYSTLAQKIKEENSYDKFLFVYNLSYLSRTVKEDNSSEFTKSIAKILKSGYGMSFATYYQNTKNSSYGLKYKYMNYGGQLGNSFVSFDDGRPRETGTYSINADVNYFALSMRSNFDFGKNKKNQFTMNSSIGYTHYSEDTGIDTNFKTTGGNIGYDINVGYLRKINSSFNLGFNLGYFASNISELTTDDGITTETFKLEKTEVLNLNNLNIGISLTYSL